MNLVRTLLLALLPALILSPAAATPKPVRRAVHDWTRMIKVTPAGAYVVGNPGARVRLVEYLSLTCSHCARFAAEGTPVLMRDYVRTGSVSLEVRHAIRDPFDLAASVLARCAGPAAVPALSARLYAGQEQWLATASAWADNPPPVDSDPIAQLRATAAGAGLPALVAPTVTAARAAACLGDRKAVDQLVAMRQEAWDGRHIPGTPAFLIDDQLQPDTNSWAGLEPKIKAALAAVPRR